MMLSELFDSKPKGRRVVKKDKDNYVIEATIGNRPILVHAQKPSPTGSVWLFWFEEETEDEHGQSKMTMKKTGSGKALEVLAFVKDVLTEFLNEYKPEKVVFEGSKSKDDNRSELYKKMLQRYNKDYTLITKDRDTSVLFTLERK